MLKLPRGWAAAPAAPTRTASPTAVESARALTGPGSRSPPGRAEPLERPGGGLRVQDMEVRVQRQRPGDVPSRAVGIAARLVDESRMEVQARVGRAEPQSLLDRGLRFHEPAVAVEGPREDVLSVDVAPHVQLLAGEMQGLDRFHVVIGVEECQLPVIDRLVEGVQRADVFDERILPARLVALAQLRLDITEGGGVLRQRDDRQRLPVEVGGAQHRYVDAADLYRKALAIIPLPEYAAALGDVQAKLGQRDEARRQYALVEYIGALNALNKTVYNRELALFYADHDMKPVEALHLARKELDVRRDIYTQDVLAWALYRNGRFVEAEAAIKEALRFGTPDPRLHFHAGLIHEARGDADGAARHVARALALNPDFHVLHAETAARTLERLRAARR